jgi:hypothetical protein
MNTEVSKSAIAGIREQIPARLDCHSTRSGSAAGSSSSRVRGRRAFNRGSAKCALSGLLFAVILASPVRAQPAEDFQKLKTMIEQMQRTIEAQNARIAELESNRTAHVTAPVPATTPRSDRLQANSPSIQTMEKVAAGEQIGHQSQVTYRGALNDQQEAASRPKDYTLDPTYQGFIPIPNTPALIKFNAKPHLDMTSDNSNAGNQNRFVPAVFPLRGAPDYGGGEQFHVNANATQLRLDVRAPELGGDFRFYYQNDFFGSGSDTGDMKYRIQHLYGQLYGFKAGFTYSVWEDPDAWPDTVDYEGPNAVIFARRPVAQYTVAWNENWNTTFGVEKPDIFVDLKSGPNAGGSTLTRVPDLGLNTRFEEKGFGHVQLSALFRDLGAKDAVGDNHHAFGWGVNVGAGLDLGPCDSAQLLAVYGHGVGGLGNDAGFFNADAAFDQAGHFEALPYWSVAAGYTHKWNDQFRSTITYGYVNLDNTSGQDPTFYHVTHYASANLVWQLRKRLSVGLEGLYGFKEVHDGTDSGNHWRVQLGMVYSLFD